MKYLELENIFNIVTKNYDTVIDGIREFLEENRTARYEVDCYMYVNTNSEEITFHSFANVGGNSWLDDDHICITSVNHEYDYVDYDDIDYDDILYLEKETAIRIIDNWLDEMASDIEYYKQFDE